MYGFYKRKNTERKKLSLLVDFITAKTGNCSIENELFPGTEIVVKAFKIN